MSIPTPGLSFSPDFLLDPAAFPPLPRPGSSTGSSGPAAKPSTAHSPLPSPSANAASPKPARHSSQPSQPAGSGYGYFASNPYASDTQQHQSQQQQLQQQQQQHRQYFPPSQPQLPHLLPPGALMPYTMSMPFQPNYMMAPYPQQQWGYVAPHHHIPSYPYQLPPPQPSAQPRHPEYHPYRRHQASASIGGGLPRSQSHDRAPSVSTMQQGPQHPRPAYMQPPFKERERTQSTGSLRDAPREC
jgi:hypothetical protein